MTIGQPDAAAGGQLVEESGNASDQINLKVMAEDNSVIQFKIKKRTYLGKLMNAYCDRVGVPRTQMIFRRDGMPILEHDTPLTHDMTENDVIEAYKLR